jgi:hypothetical protein
LADVPRATAASSDWRPWRWGQTFAAEPAAPQPGTVNLHNQLQQRSIAVVCAVTPGIGGQCDNQLATHICSDCVATHGGDSTIPQPFTATQLGDFVAQCVEGTVARPSVAGRLALVPSRREMRGMQQRLRAQASVPVEDLLTAAMVFDEKPIELTVNPPFAQHSGLRFAVASSWDPTTRVQHRAVIAKDFQDVGKDTIAEHLLLLRGTTIARRLAQKFCKAVDRSTDVLKYVQSYIVRVSNATACKTSRLFTVEDFMAAAPQKFNLNTGVVLERHRKHSFVQAFTHFTYHATGGKIMVLDVQGMFKTNGATDATYHLCDPAITTPNPSDFPSATNLGAEAIQTFLRFHVCGATCQKLGLPKLQ